MHKDKKWPIGVIRKVKQPEKKNIVKNEDKGMWKRKR